MDSSLDLKIDKLLPDRPEYAQQFSDAGITTVREFLEFYIQQKSVVESSTTAAALSQAEILLVLERVELLLLEGMNPKTFTLLITSGIHTIAQISIRDPVRLSEVLAETNRRLRAASRAPSTREIADLVLQAQQATRENRLLVQGGPGARKITTVWDNYWRERISLWFRATVFFSAWTLIALVTTIAIFSLAIIWSFLSFAANTEQAELLFCLSRVQVADLLLFTMIFWLLSFALPLFFAGWTFLASRKFAEILLKEEIERRVFMIINTAQQKSVWVADSKALTAAMIFGVFLLIYFLVILEWFDVQFSVLPLLITSIVSLKLFPRQLQALREFQRKGLRFFKRLILHNLTNAVFFMASLVVLVAFGLVLFVFLAGGPLAAWDRETMPNLLRGCFATTPYVGLIQIPGEDWLFVFPTGVGSLKEYFVPSFLVPALATLAVILTAVIFAQFYIVKSRWAVLTARIAILAYFLGLVGEAMLERLVGFEAPELPFVTVMVMIVLSVTRAFMGDALSEVIGEGA
ncbi:MAG: DUF4332 domain-containing protein [Chloroflexi bacterium]|nr:DUF4332 domain-containing protein [Chloroflexota bacterium]